MRRLTLSVSAALTLWLLAVVPAAVAAQRRQSVSIPAGTEIKVRLTGQLDTGVAKAGQAFSGTLAQPVVTGGRTVFAKGTRVDGRVIEAVSSGRLKRPASITLQLTSIGGRAVSSEPLRIDGKSHLLRNAALIGGGAGAGAVLGGIAGGKKGAVVGAAVGAGAGTATAFITGKNEIALPAETELPFITGGTVTSSTASASGPAVQKGSKAIIGEPGRVASEGPVSQAAQAAEALVFSDRDRGIIRSYFQAQRSNLPPGLAKRGGRLPPGLERHLQKNGTLPPGLQKRIEPFPADLNSQLPRIPGGYSRVILAGRALLLDRNNKILDLMAVFQ